MIKEITLTLDRDGDGTPDDEDECPLVFGSPEFNGCPAGVRVSVQEVNGAMKPAVHQDTALETKIFDLSSGSCASNIGATPGNYAQIYNSCGFELVKKETYSPNDGAKKPRNFISDLVTFGITTGDKLVLVKSQSNLDGSSGYAGFKLPDMKKGEIRNAGFNIVSGKDTYVQTAIFTSDSKGVWHSSRIAQVIKGSELEIFQSDFETWDDSGERIYPFTFISAGDWDINVCLEVPEGYEIVAPGTCDQTLISNEAKVLEFTLTDVASPKEFKVKAKIDVKHKGKNHKIDLEVGSFNKHVKESKAQEKVEKAEEKVEKAEEKVEKALQKGATLWSSVKDTFYMAGYVLSNNQIFNATKVNAQENNISVPEWGVNSGATDHKSIKEGTKLLFNLFRW